MEIKSQIGFTLLEVLVSMIVLSIGLLGLAGLQTTGLKNNLSAYHRSQATQFAYNIADRMRANSTETNNFAASTYITADPATVTAVGACTTTTGCTAIEMAQTDLFEWNAALTSVLAKGQGIITVVPPLYTVTINWDDNRDGCVNPGDPAAGCSSKSDDPNFQVSFEL